MPQGGGRLLHNVTFDSIMELNFYYVKLSFLCDIEFHFTQHAV